MKILIVEDEKPIAIYIEKLCRSILKNKIQSIYINHTLDQVRSTTSSTTSTAARPSNT